MYLKLSLELSTDKHTKDYRKFPIYHFLEIFPHSNFAWSMTNPKVLQSNSVKLLWVDKLGGPRFNYLGMIIRYLKSSLSCIWFDWLLNIIDSKLYFKNKVVDHWWFKSLYYLVFIIPRVMVVTLNYINMKQRKKWLRDV